MCCWALRRTYEPIDSGATQRSAEHTLNIRPDFERRRRRKTKTKKNSAEASAAEVVDYRIIHPPNGGQHVLRGSPFIADLCIVGCCCLDCLDCLAAHVPSYSMRTLPHVCDILNACIVLLACTRARAQRTHIVLTTMSQYIACDATQKRQNTVRAANHWAAFAPTNALQKLCTHFTSWIIRLLHHESESFCCFCSFISGNRKKSFFFFHILSFTFGFGCSSTDDTCVQVTEPSHIGFKSAAASTRHHTDTHVFDMLETAEEQRTIERWEQWRTVSAIAYVIYVFFVLEKWFVLSSLQQHK